MTNNMNIQAKLKPTLLCALLALVLCAPSPAWATFDLQITINNIGFNPSQQAILADATAKAEAVWEDVITGYAPGISNTGIAITIQNGSSFADATPLSTEVQGGFFLAKTGRVRISPLIVTAFSAWDGSGPTNPDPNHIGKNYVDDIIAHEIGHVLGIGTLWSGNRTTQTIFDPSIGRNRNVYIGKYGLRAYQREFDPNAIHIPLEDSGAAGTIGTHWDQVMRSSTQEGNPSDPWNEDPRVGVTDQFGRDRALELLTGALDPDYGEPFLSMTSIQSLRDLGFTVVPEPTTFGLALVGALGILRRTRR